MTYVETPAAQGCSGAETERGRRASQGPIRGTEQLPGKTWLRDQPSTPEGPPGQLLNGRPPGPRMVPRPTGPTQNTPNSLWASPHTLSLPQPAPGCRHPCPGPVGSAVFSPRPSLALGDPTWLELVFQPYPSRGSYCQPDHIPFSSPPSVNSSGRLALCSIHTQPPCPL